MVRGTRRIPMAVLVAMFLVAQIDAIAAAGTPVGPRVTLWVDGLACPFCAYGLEKKLSRLEGVESVGFDIDEGEVELSMAPGEVPDRDTLADIVDAAGFTMRDVVWTVAGRLSAAGEELIFEAEGRRGSWLVRPAAGRRAGPGAEAAPSLDELAVLARQGARIELVGRLVQGKTPREQVFEVRAIRSGSTGQSAGGASGD